jgi:hypothetical protein
MILLTFALKVGLAVYFSQLLFCQVPENKIGFIANGIGDTPSYIGSIDNFIDEGTYYFWNGTRRVYAGRMPHYGAPYYIFRLVFDKTAASDIYVLFQILFDSVATVFFALLCFEVLKNKFAFVFGFFFYFLNFNLFWLSSILFTESLSLSLFVLFLYSFNRYWSDEKFSSAIVAAIFLALVTSLKPYLAIVYLPFFLSVFFKEKSFYSLRRVVLLLIPLLILLAPWIARNAIVLGKFIPTQESTTAGYNYTQADFAFRRFVGAWGGDFIFWNPNSAGCYFQFKPSAGCNFKIPDYALTDGYTMSDVEDVRNDYVRLQENYSSELEQTVITKFDRLTNIHKSERPFMYHIGSRFIMVKNLLWHTNSYNLPILSNFRCYKSYQLIFKGISFVIYLLSMTIGIIGLYKLSVERKISLLFVSVPLLILCFFAALRFVEYRYFNHAFPIFALGAVYILCAFANNIRQNARQVSTGGTDLND